MSNPNKQTTEDGPAETLRSSDWLGPKNQRLKMTLRCMIHNVTFSTEGVADGFPMECPVCVREEMNRLRAAFDRARDERNALLRAIEIKRDALLQPQP